MAVKQISYAFHQMIFIIKWQLNRRHMQLHQIMKYNFIK